MTTRGRADERWIPLMRRFSSRSEPGPALATSADLRRARKRELMVHVSFATEAGNLQTPEGLVLVQAGDAIVQDDQHRLWRVSRRHFDAKYELVAGERYRTHPVEVRARQMAEPFEVLLSDGHSLLLGVPGDWLVDYEDGSLGVVAKAAFSASYELID